jgi:hypothetical protein
MFLTPLCWQALLFRFSCVYVFDAEFRAILRVPGRVVEAKIAGLIRPRFAKDRTALYSVVGRFNPLTKVRHYPHPRPAMNCASGWFGTLAQVRGALTELVVSRQKPNRRRTYRVLSGVQEQGITTSINHAFKKARRRTPQKART